MRKKRQIKHRNYQIIISPKNGAKTGRRTGRKKKGETDRISLMLEETL